MTGPEALDLIGKIGNPVLLFIVGVIIVAQFASERLSKILGPLGKIGRWWHTREERAEEDFQKLLAARAKTHGYQLQDMENQLRYFLEVVDNLRSENQQLRDELGEVHSLLTEARRELHSISDRLDTDERLIVRPRPAVPLPGRHRGADDADTDRMPRMEG